MNRKYMVNLSTINQDHFQEMSISKGHRPQSQDHWQYQ